MNVDAESIGLVIFPLALVDVAIRVPELASAVSLVLAPLTFVLGTIRPDLNTRSMSHSIFEVALVDCTILENQLVNELESLLFRGRFELSEQLVVREVEL